MYRILDHQSQSQEDCSGGCQLSGFTPSTSLVPPWTNSPSLAGHTLPLDTFQLDSPSPEAEEIKPILVTFNYVQFDTDTASSPATRELQVGCIRTTQPSPRKVITTLARVKPQKPPCPPPALYLTGLV